MALVYLVNKPQVSGKIVRWLLLFLEYHFIVVYKPGKIHGMENAMSRSPSGEPTTSMENQMADASLFFVQLITPNWLQDITTYLQTGTLPVDMPKDE
jgi:hypothetical protein